MVLHSFLGLGSILGKSQEWLQLDKGYDWEWFYCIDAVWIMCEGTSQPSHILAKFWVWSVIWCRWFQLLDVWGARLCKEQWMVWVGAHLFSPLSLLPIRGDWHSGLLYPLPIMHTRYVWKSETLFLWWFASQVPTTDDPGTGKPGSHELSPYGWKEPKYLIYHLLLLGMHISRKVDWANLNLRHSGMGYGHTKWHLNHWATHLFSQLKSIMVRENILHGFYPVNLFRHFIT